MALPYSYTIPILDQLPAVPRPLKLPELSKATKYLELAEVLLRRFPSESNGRAAKFLIDLTRCTDPGPAAQLSWFTTPGARDLIEIGHLGGIARIVPTLRFEARFARR